MKKLILFVLLIFSCLKLYSQTPIDANPTWKFDPNNLTPLTDNELVEAFKLVKDSGIEFRYPQGGCQQRAEMMHTILEQNQIPHARVFIFSPMDLVEGSGTKLEVADPSGLSPNNTIFWPYHVAPCIALTKPGGKKQLMIIDPALNSTSPLPINDWFAKMKNANVSRYSIVKPEAYFFFTINNNSTVINGNFYKYEGWSYNNALVEREIALNDVALFLKEKLDNGYSDPKGEIKKLLSSVNSMLGYFSSQNNTIEIQGVNIRDLLEHHPTLMNEAMKYYTDRVSFWIKKYKEIKFDQAINLQPKQQDIPVQDKSNIKLKKSKLKKETKSKS